MRKRKRCSRWWTTSSRTTTSSACSTTSAEQARGYQLRQPAPELIPSIENSWFVSAADGVAVDMHVDVFVDARADLICTFGAPYASDVIGGAPAVHAHSNLDAQRLVPIRIIQRGDVLPAIRGSLPDFAPVFARYAADLVEACTRR